MDEEINPKGGDVHVNPNSVGTVSTLKGRHYIIMLLLRSKSKHNTRPYNLLLKDLSVLK